MLIAVNLYCGISILIEIYFGKYNTNMGSSLWDTFYHVADDSVQFIPKFLDFSGMQWTDLVTRILVNPACLQVLN